MNGKITQIIGLRNYHQHPNPARLASQKWTIVIDRLKKVFPNTMSFFSNAAKRLEYIKMFQNRLKMVGSFLGKECSPIFAQRAFRSYRMIQLHSRLWSCNNPHVSNKALFSFVILSLCKANTSLRGKILDSELCQHLQDLEYFHELTTATVVCHQCKDRLIVDNQITGVKYCTCVNSKPVYNRKVEGYPWLAFVETPDLIVWRRPHPDYPSLYIYKVYGYYDDLTAVDFLEAQLDIQFRKTWDDHSLKLDIVDRDSESRTELIHWEMRWPKMFANRDYLFLRRHLIDKECQNMVIMSRAIHHPKIPAKKGVHRVTEYWSVMHIRAPKGLSEPGVEFGLTYFDNPGLSLPQWLMNWAAMNSIPDFLNKQRNAARTKRDLRIAQIPVTKPIAVISSKPHYSEKDVNSITSSKSQQNVSEDKSSDSSNLNTAATPTPPSPTSPQSTQQESKGELLSQFFKEQILDVHS